MNNRNSITFKQNFLNSIVHILKVICNVKKVDFIIQLFILFILMVLSSCSEQKSDIQNVTKDQINIIFLHHSTGECIWYGNKSTLKSVFQRKILHESAVTKWFKDYNSKNEKNYVIQEMNFPKSQPYGWNNFPFDYYNIWVKHAGPELYKEEPTLEILTAKYDIVIWKHCFPVGLIKEDLNYPDITSDDKRVENYELQYQALKDKMHEFPDTKFIVWTGPALVKDATNEDYALRTRNFFDWVRTEWNDPDDNIFLWDFYYLETEGGLYMKEEFAVSKVDSHPNDEFAGRIYSYFCNRTVDVIEYNGMKTKITGERN